MRISEADLVHIDEKKPSYPIRTPLYQYLGEYGRLFDQDLNYKELREFSEQIPLYDRDGIDSYWQTVLYAPAQRDLLDQRLCQVYAALKMEGNQAFLKHLYIDRIDYCEFGNSQPFRIRVVNRYNDNHDYYYVKKADASRIYGLELEHILSPNRINILVHGETLIEEHISGIPGDIFIGDYLIRDPEINRIRVSKEFVKFSERCFAKLLGDMRSYNFVMVLTQDFDAKQYRVRAIDFDRQCHEPQLKVYMPQFYQENQEVVEMVWDCLPPETIRQYQSEERSLMRRRANSARLRLEDLFAAMAQDPIAPPANIDELALELSNYHKDPSFTRLRSMGELTRRHLFTMLEQRE
jgi:hypothetical protein